jgi:radical SAM protein with 4Fe4S-binding SPASM domain
MASVNYSTLFSMLGKLHSLVPAGLGAGWALPPLFVQVEVTHRCNAGCPMCYQSSKLGADAEMSLTEIEHIVDQVPPWGVLSLTGGEPFLRKDFASILEYGLKKRRCTILTNGSLVTDDHVDLMVRSRLLLMAVSIDGIGSIHDGIRRMPGLFDHAVSTIQRVQKKKKELGSRFPLIDVKTVILKENLHQLPDILELAGSLSVDFITFSVERGMDNLYSAPYRQDIREICQTPPAYPRLDDDDLALLLRQIAKLRHYNGTTRVRFYPDNLMNERLLGGFYHQELSPSDFAACTLPWSRMSISPHGDVYPCLSFLVGNARQESLSRIWNGPRFREFRRHLDRKNLSAFCLGCCNSVCRRTDDDLPQQAVSKG